MVSEWRLNVNRLGLNNVWEFNYGPDKDKTVRLAAELLELPGFYLTNVEGTEAGERRVAVDPGGSQGYVLLRAFFPPNPNVNFPYGWEVRSDRPV